MDREEVQLRKKNIRSQEFFVWEVIPGEAETATA
jgi:hypothetical protein